MPLRLAGLWALLLGAFALQGVGAANLRRFKPRVSGECGKDRRCAAEEVFHAYLDWHNDTLTNYPCEQNRALLWRPSAGFGDSVLALAAAWQMAMQLGRVFVVDWGSAPFRVGFSGPLRHPFKRLDPQNAAALAAGREDVEEPVVYWDLDQLPCQVSEFGDAFKVKGSYTARDPAFAELVRIATRRLKQQGVGVDEMPDGEIVMRHADRFPRREWLLQRLAHPSQPVLRVLAPALARLDGGFRVGLQIRTGTAATGERAPFLGDGDEKLFFDCVEEYAASRAIPTQSLRVFVASDSYEVLRRARERFGRRAISVEGPIMHSLTARSVSAEEHPLDADVAREVAEAVGSDPERTAGMLKMYADWFGLMHTDMLLVTNWSLFGAAASDVAGMDQDYGHPHGTHHINARSCEETGRCKAPRVPTICPNLMRDRAAKDEL